LDSVPNRNPAVTWVFEEGTFVPAAKLTENQRLSIVGNYMGTPEAMYREDGEAVWTCELNGYGKVRKFQGDSKTDCPFRYQGQYEDSETGLYYNRFRYYSPDEGMYISQDPIRLGGGINLYSYVHDTNGWVDILGLSQLCSDELQDGQFYDKKGILRNKDGTFAGGENVSAARGREAHKNYKNALPETYEHQVTLDNDMRPDALDWNARVVRELKPDTPSGHSKGQSQVNSYVKQLELQTGQLWTGVVDYYNI
jgi:RHS repeat-associated protein